MIKDEFTWSKIIFVSGAQIISVADSRVGRFRAKKLSWQTFGVNQGTDPTAVCAAKLPPLILHARVWESVAAYGSYSTAGRPSNASSQRFSKRSPDRVRNRVSVIFTSNQSVDRFMTACVTVLDEQKDRKEEPFCLKLQLLIKLKIKGCICLVDRLVEQLEHCACTLSALLFKGPKSNFSGPSS